MKKFTWPLPLPLNSRNEARWRDSIRLSEREVAAAWKLMADVLEERRKDGQPRE